MLTKSTQEFAQKCASKGRLLALDLGDAHIGVAISNSARTLATPRNPINAKKGWQSAEAHILNMIEEDDIAGLIVGWPLHMDGSTDGAADKAESRAHRLSELSSLPALLFDERLTTSGAETLLFDYRAPNSRQTRASKKDIKPALDSTAAALILDTAMAALPKIS